MTGLEPVGENNMVYSENLGRRVDVPIEMLNRFDEVEIGAALSAIPGYPDLSEKDIRAAAEMGDINARFIIERAKDGDPVASDWFTAP